MVDVAIVGTGNIGSDLLAKLFRSKSLRPRYFVGVDPDSEGLRGAAQLDVEVSAGGVDWLLARPELPGLVFEATSAKAHAENAPRYEAHGIRAIDLTPAALGPMVVPTVNVHENLDVPNLNMVTCGGQATIPIVAAVRKATDVAYAEIVSSISSRSAGPGTRANIDEFTTTTADAIERIGGADRGKAIIILNPAEPPLIMRATVFCAMPDDADQARVSTEIERMVDAVAQFVPGYRLVAPPQFDAQRVDGRDFARVCVLLEVEGRGDFLPRYAGNLDIMTSAAVRVGEMVVGERP